MGLMAGAAIGAGTKLLGGMANNAAEKKQKAAMEEQRRKQKIELVKQMNWADASTVLEFRNLLDSTVDQLTEVNFAAIRNSSAAAAGISESGMEGRTTDRAQRKADQVGLKAAARLNENYERDYASLLGEREKQWQAGLSQIEGLGDEIKVKGSGLNPLDILSGGISGAMTGDQLGKRIKTNKESK